MTKNKSLKRRVRERMSKTGERYTSARRQVLAKVDAGSTEQPDQPSVDQPAPTEPQPTDGGPSDETVAERTGRPWQEWRSMLDGSGAADRPHPEIVRWLMDKHGVDGWWAQSLTVRYEKAIGRRVLGQRSGGIFVASATKTVNAPADRAFDAFVDADERSHWLPDLELTLRTASRPRSARFNVGDGSQRLNVGFDAKGTDRCTVSVEHERLPDARETEHAKALWRERLSELKRVLEG